MQLTRRGDIIIKCPTCNQPAEFTNVFLDFNNMYQQADDDVSISDASSTEGHDDDDGHDSVDDHLSGIDRHADFTPNQIDGTIFIGDSDDNSCIDLTSSSIPLSGNNRPESSASASTSATRSSRAKRTGQNKRTKKSDGIDTNQSPSAYISTYHKKYKKIKRKLYSVTHAAKSYQTNSKKFEQLHREAKGQIAMIKSNESALRQDLTEFSRTRQRMDRTLAKTKSELNKSQSRVDQLVREKSANVELQNRREESYKCNMRALEKEKEKCTATSISEVKEVMAANKEYTRKHHELTQEAKDLLNENKYLSKENVRLSRLHSSTDPNARGLDGAMLRQRIKPSRPMSESKRLELYKSVQQEVEDQRREDEKYEMADAREKENKAMRKKLKSRNMSKIIAASNKAIKKQKRTSRPTFTNSSAPSASSAPMNNELRRSANIVPGSSLEPTKIVPRLTSSSLSMSRGMNVPRSATSNIRKIGSAGTKNPYSRSRALERSSDLHSFGFAAKRK